MIYGLYKFCKAPPSKGKLTQLHSLYKAPLCKGSCHSFAVTEGLFILSFLITCKSAACANNPPADCIGTPLCTRGASSGCVTQLPLSGGAFAVGGDLLGGAFFPLPRTHDPVSAFQILQHSRLHSCRTGNFADCGRLPPADFHCNSAACPQIFRIPVKNAPIEC